MLSFDFYMLWVHFVPKISRLSPANFWTKNEELSRKTRRRGSQWSSAPEGDENPLSLDVFRTRSRRICFNCWCLWTGIINFIISLDGVTVSSSRADGNAKIPRILRRTPGASDTRRVQRINRHQMIVHFPSAENIRTHWICKLFS